MRDVGLYLRRRAGVIALLAALAVLAALLGWLNGLEWKHIGYGLALGALLSGCVGVLDCVRFTGRLRMLRSISAQVRLAEDFLPESGDPLEREYQTLIRALLRDRAERVSRMDQKMRNMTGYYTLWAHQIKTPIAAMHLLLQERGEETGELGQELLRIEQYVDMALQYLRLDSGHSDYVIRRCELDDIVRAAVRKLAPQFIRKKLALRYEPLNVRVLTDEKWLSFVIEQVLSNAVKYTPSGEVRIFCEEGPVLVIADTGIGVAPEDLPRVFEQGFTGYNGRADKKATGIGLYLCRRVCRKLGHGISMESEVGKGTRVRIDLRVTERIQE